MICKQCRFLRTDITAIDDNILFRKKYGVNASPCNRFPQNSLRSPKEPACGEFQHIDDSRRNEYDHQEEQTP